MVFGHVLLLDFTTTREVDVLQLIRGILRRKETNSKLSDVQVNVKFCQANESRRDNATT